MDCSLPGSSVRGIFLARILEWIAISFSRGSSRLRERTGDTALQADALPSELPGSGRSAGKGIGYPVQYSWASLVAQLVKNLPAKQETGFRFLGWEDPWSRNRLPTPVFWPREFYGLYSLSGCKESDTTERLCLTSLHTHSHSSKPSYQALFPAQLHSLPTELSVVCSYFSPVPYPHSSKSDLVKIKALPCLKCPNAFSLLSG